MTTRMLLTGLGALALALTGCPGDAEQGEPGKQGDKGPAGDVGPVGPVGPRWQPQIYIVTENGDPTDEIQALCNPGGWLVSGGCVADSTNVADRIVSSLPQGSNGYPDRQVCGGVGIIQATAVCMLGQPQVVEQP